jgi:hypothetical protein
VSGGELYGQRDAVETPTDRSNHRQILAVWRKLGTLRPRVGDKELHRAMCKDAVNFCLIVTWQIQGGTRYTYSPSIRKTSRLVARTDTCGQRRTIVSAILAAASMTCSQLSETNRVRFPPTARAIDSGEISPPPTLRSRTPAIAEGTRPGSNNEGPTR